jgi:hypothetical protein
LAGVNGESRPSQPNAPEPPLRQVTLWTNPWLIPTELIEVLGLDLFAGGR